MRNLLSISGKITLVIVCTIGALLFHSILNKQETRKVDPRKQYYRYEIRIPAGHETFVKLCDRESGNEVLITKEYDRGNGHLITMTSSFAGYSNYCKNVTEEQVKNRWEEAGFR
jgi:hypothetical protein